MRSVKVSANFKDSKDRRKFHSVGVQCILENDDLRAVRTTTQLTISTSPLFHSSTPIQSSTESEVGDDASLYSPPKDPDLSVISGEPEARPVSASPNLHEEEKYIVFESKLMELFHACPTCGSVCQAGRCCLCKGQQLNSFVPGVNITVASLLNP